MLTLPIKKKWFDMIRTGVKKEEYRSITPYYQARFRQYADKEFLVKLRNGYSLLSPYVICSCTVRIGEGRPEWGATSRCFILSIKKIVETKLNDTKFD